MKEFLRKIRLLDDLVTELNIRQNDFVEILRAHVDEGSTGSMSGLLSMFSSSKNDYIGHVDFSHFKIKKKGFLIAI